MDTILNIPSTWTGHRDFAHWLTQRLDPKITVDLGVDLGFSMFSLAEKSQGQVYGIDTFEGDNHEGHKQGSYEQCVKFKEDNRFDNVTIIRDTFENVNATWNKPIDILHIDGFHEYASVKKDFYTWAKFVTDYGVVLLHDTSSHYDVARFFDEIQLPKIAFRHSAGLGVVCMDQSLIDEIKAQWPDAIRTQDISAAVNEMQAKIKNDLQATINDLDTKIKDSRGGTIGSTLFQS
jgi:hypothetical protein